jgi:hypothetical protein
MTPRLLLGGRSGVLRGLIALVAAPVLIALPLGLFLDALDAWGGGGLSISARSLLRLAPVLIRLTLLLGAPVWVVLRLIGRESGHWLWASGSAARFASACCRSHCLAAS